MEPVTKKQAIILELKGYDLDQIKKLSKKKAIKIISKIFENEKRIRSMHTPTIDFGYEPLDQGDI